jgi:N-acetylglucosamine-6-phosphate deacetylase
MKYALVNCNIYTGNEIVYNKAIIIENNYIKSLVDASKVPFDMDFIDLGGLSVAPGFIDLQVNGGGGYFFTDNPTEEAVSTIFEAHKKFGTTNFLPTIISTSYENIIKAINTVGKCLSNNKYGVLGLHIEGPYLNDKKAGVHNKKSIRSIQDEEFYYLIEKGTNIIKLITLAPENVDKRYIQMCINSGIRVSAGHSDSTYEQACEAFKIGVSSVTHIFNAMSQLGSREPGLVGAALENDDIWASIIVDGVHVHFSSVRICKRVKPLNKLFLITDAMPPVGKPEETFKIGDSEIFCKEGKCITKDGILAGSSLDMATAVRNCVQRVGIPIDEALRMASTYPAEFLGINNLLGRIKPNFIANLAIFDNQLHVRGTVINGKYEATKEVKA